MFTNKKGRGWVFISIINTSWTFGPPEPKTDRLNTDIMMKSDIELL